MQGFIPNSNEVERSASWIHKKVVNSVNGRVAMASYESLRATGKAFSYLSPWGDSNPLCSPCIRGRDVVVHMAMMATGGGSAVIHAALESMADAVDLGDTIIVEVVLNHLTNMIVHDCLSNLVSSVIPIHSKKLETTAVKVLLITLKYKHTTENAQLGYFHRGHSHDSLLTSVKDYLAVEKGWFAPYLHASSRRPEIPREVKQDIIFCNGPFVSGDYQIGERLLNESTCIILLCDAPPATKTEVSPKKEQHKALSLFSRASPPEPTLIFPPTPRRMVILFLGLKPHRKIWSTSRRPGESVIHYILLNGCPAIVVPVTLSAPVVAWHCLTAKQLWNIDLPAKDGIRSSSGKFEDVVDVIFDCVATCIDWQRIKLPSSGAARTLKHALTSLVAATIRAKTGELARKELDPDRSGIAMWRIL